MGLTVITIVIGARWTVPKRLDRRLVEFEVRVRIKIIQSTALLGSPEYWEESWRPEETGCNSDSSESAFAHAGIKNSQGIFNNNNNNNCLWLINEGTESMPKVDRDTGKLQHIGQHILKKRQKIQAMTLIDYDMFP